ncbi:MAG: alpha-2-macroglobulin family protein [bacterium]|nr:alpha-2-macroglobulin family protein [bacterium]
MLNKISRLWNAGEGESRRTPLFISLAILIIFVTATITISLPDNEIRVISFEPTGRTELRTNVTIKFSKRMVPTDSLDKPVLNPPLRFEPPIPGIARWVDSDLLRFFPDAALLPSTEYTASVKSDRVWISGLKIINPETYKFRTPGLRLERQRCNAEELFDETGRLRLVGRFVFNYAVNLKDLQDRLEIKGTNKAAKPSLKYTITFTGERVDGADEEAGGENAPAATQPSSQYGYDYTVISEPFERTDASQYYAFTISTGLGCQNCQFPLEDAISNTIAIDPKQPLVIQSVRSSNEGEMTDLRIDFSHRIDAEIAKTFISVEPAIEFTLEENYSTVILHGGFRPGETYNVRVAKGLACFNGSPLQNDFSALVQIADLRPSIGFTSKGIFLPRTGNGLLEFKSVNIDKAVVEIEQVFANNLVYFLISGYSSPYAAEESYWDNRAQMLGRSLFIKDVPLDSPKNTPLLTTVDIGSLVGPKAKGIFKVSAVAKDERWTGESRYVMITDMGLSARMGDNYLMVWANSLANSTPIPGATIRLISKNNQTLLEGKTDGRGMAIFKDIKDKLTNFEPFVIIAEREDDLSYIRLDESLLPVADFDVAGRPYLTSGYEAFLYTDRGVYRPGDTLRITSIVRGVDVKVPPSFPYNIVVFDTKGRKFTSFRLTSDAGNLNTLDYVMPEYAATGKYALTAMIGDELTIGRVEVLVEDFMPDRIKVIAATNAPSYQAGQTILTDVDGKMLFGPPAAGYQLRGNIQVENQSFTPKEFPGYSFANSDRTFTRMDVDFPDALLNDTGGYQYSYQIPEKLAAPGLLKGLIGVTVSEPGGRGVSAYSEVVIHPYPRYVGLRMAREEYAEPGTPTEVKLVAVGQDGNSIPLEKCVVRFFSVQYNTIYKKDRTGLYRWISERRTKLIDSNLVALPVGGTTVPFTASTYGAYRLVLEDLQGGHSSSIEFWASGWGYTPWAMDNPDKIELGLDKKEYQAGETALLQVRAPFGGKLLVTVEKDQILDVITYDMAENTAEIKIPVQKQFLPNVYITATVIRPSASLEPLKPARAFGLIPLRVSNESKKIAMTITAPSVMTPRSKATVTVQLPKGKQTDLTIAAVDAGILQLTDFKTPDPLDFFWGKRQPYLKPYDLYAFLYPQVKKSSNHLAAGDKMFAAARKRHLNPFMAKRVKAVSLWSGLVKTDKNGLASVTFDLPEFNGKLVLMAVSANGDQFGSATAEMFVRDKIVVMESFPRFVSPNDVFEGLVTLYNNTGAAADITATLSADGPVELLSPTSVKVAVENGKEGKAIFRLKAGQAPGKLSFRINATAGGEKSGVSVELTNRPALPLTTLYGSGTASVGKPAEFNLPGNWLPGTDQFVIQTSAISTTPFARNLQYLLAYPYGCVEQTTSRLFPMLYYEDLVRVVNPALFGGKSASYFVQEGITRLYAMLLPDGTFGFWPGATYSNPWTTIYASHFLSEASRAGYVVDKKFLNAIYENLEDVAAGKRTNDMTDVHRIYAAYVLAGAGRLNQKTIGYLKRLDPAVLMPESRFQLSAALALSGNAAEATKLLPVTIQPNIFEPETGGLFRSGVRADAIGLDALLIAAPGSPAIEVYVRSLADRASAGEWYSTQDNAFALLALGKYFKMKKGFGYSGTLTVNGQSPDRIDSTGFKLSQAGLSGKTVKINIASGEGTCYYYWQASGVPSSPAIPEFDRGMKVRREYLDEDARPIDPTKVKLGDRVICVITAEAIDKNLQNVVINDLLPAGFEIENPRLKTSARLSWVPDGAPVDYQDIRDDRLLIFTSLYPRQSMKFYYSLRAICAGEFKIPPVSAECMYNPMIASSASSGALTVTR